MAAAVKRYDMMKGIILVTFFNVEDLVTISYIFNQIVHVKKSAVKNILLEKSFYRHFKMVIAV